MISTELLRRYPFFANFSHTELVYLADAAEETSVAAGAYFFREGDELDQVYLLLKGKVGITFQVPHRALEHPLSDQLTGEMQTQEVLISTLGSGDVFAWSSMVPPHTATASSKALADCRVVIFDCHQLWPKFEQDCQFGYHMMVKIARIMRERLHDTRMESLSLHMG